jgi:hypothetical protein
VCSAGAYCNTVATFWVKMSKSRFESLACQWVKANDLKDALIDVCLELYPTVVEFQDDKNEIKTLLWNALEEDERACLIETNAKKTNSKAKKDKRKLILAKLNRWYNDIGSIVYGVEHFCSPRKSKKRVVADSAESVDESVDESVESESPPRRRSTRTRKKVSKEDFDASDASENGASEYTEDASTVEGTPDYWKIVTRFKNRIYQLFGFEVEVITKSPFDDDDDDEDSDGDYGDYDLPPVPTHAVMTDELNDLKARFDALAAT